MRISTRANPWSTTALVALVFGFSACDEVVTNLVNETVGQAAVGSDVSGLLADVTEGLTLTASQTTAVNELATSFGERMREPGALWRLAGELHEALTTEQIAQIMDRQQERLEQMASRTGERPGFGHRRGLGQGPRGGLTRFLSNATEEQWQAIHEVLESFRPRFERLREQLHSGEITREEFRSRVHELRNAAHAEIEPLLTDEQRAAMEAHLAERHAFMEEVRAVRIEVLGLADAQIAELETLKEQRMSEPLGDATIAERIAAHREAAAAILSETQMEIASLYHALCAGALWRAGCGARGPFSGFHGV